MADDWEDLAAKGRAAELANTAQRAKLRAEDEARRDTAVELVAARRLSPLAGSPLRFLFSLPAAIVWGTTAMMAIPYFRYFATGAPVRGGSAARGTWTLDPARDGYALFYLFLVTTAFAAAGVIWRLRLVPTGRRVIAEEVAWAAALPFPLVNYPYAAGMDEHRFKLRVRLENDVEPPRELEDVVRGVDGFASINENGKIVIDYPREAAFKNARRLVVTIHALTDAVLVPLHAKTPIERITMND